MKNNTRKRKTHGPSENTHWAYMMQAIEPKSQAINKMFPNYHPQWVQVSQKMTIGAANFTLLRMALGLSMEQCAAYLRVSTKSVYNWGNGFAHVPFAEFELLRLVLESVPFKLSHPEWDGWFMSKDGHLVSPYGGRRGYTPADLNMLTITMAESSRVSSEVKRLQGELDSAIAENTRLRQMFLSQGVVDELAAMQDKLSALMNSIGTAHVIPFPLATSEQPEQSEQPKVQAA